MNLRYPFNTHSSIHFNGEDLSVVFVAADDGVLLEVAHAEFEGVGFEDEGHKAARKQPFGQANFFIFWWKGKSNIFMIYSSSGFLYLFKYITYGFHRCTRGYHWRSVCKACILRECQLQGIWKERESSRLKDFVKNKFYYYGLTFLGNQYQKTRIHHHSSIC